MELNIPALVILVIVSYLIGNISPAVIIGRIYGVDIKKEGSGNPGTTNVLRVIGAKAAAATLLIDAVKGYIPVMVGYNVGGIIGAQLAFAAVVIGHVYPVFYHFKGGKGVATSLGAALALNWVSAVLLLILALAIVAGTRIMSIGSLTAAILYPLMIWRYQPDALPVAIFIALFLLYTHRSNIKRLYNGQENKLDFGKIKKSMNGAKESVKVVVDDVKESVADALPMEADVEKTHYPSAEPAVSIEEEPVDYFVDVECPRREESDISRIAVIGAGSFGTALANVLIYNGHDVTVWARNEKQIEELRDKHTNSRYLPGVLISDKINYTSDLSEAVTGKNIIIFAVPAQSFSEMALKVSELVDDKDIIIVNLAKGIERGSLRTISAIAAEVFPDNPYVALSGPSHAEEIARNFPTTVVVASKDSDASATVQDVFMGKKFRVYTSDDVVGVELGGALKNVIAIATGISDGMKLGDNTKAALMTRGMHEIKRLGMAMGATDVTFSGLSGIGDLIVTCGSDLSRNRRCGILIGSGLTPEEAVQEIGTTVEGFYTVDAAYQLAHDMEIDMPITDAIHDCLKGESNPLKALAELMERDKKEETK